MEAVTLVVQWCHVAAGILWVGGAAVLELVARPILERLPPETERAVGARMGRALVPYFAVAGTATIVFGVLRGTLFGPIRSFADLGTKYGIAWCVALAVAATLAVLGAVGIGRTSTVYYETEAFWRSAAGPGEAPVPQGLPAEAARVRRRLVRLGRLQLSGFAAILVCMLLMSELFS